MRIDTGARRPVRIARALVLLGALALWGGAPLAGQEEPVRTRPSFADSLSYRIATIEPTSGPPGTFVAVRWELLPAITPMRLGVGAQRVGFEVLSEIMTDERGQFADTIRIPDWAETTRPVMLVVFDFFFNPQAISSGFQVTAPDGTLSRTGRLEEPSGACAEMVSEDARYYLAGDVGAYRPGDRVFVRATVGEPGDCGRGERDVVLQVLSIRRAIGG